MRNMHLDRSQTMFFEHFFSSNSVIKVELNMSLHFFSSPGGYVIMWSYSFVEGIRQTGHGQLQFVPRISIITHLPLNT
jgi:hypothetical protein